MQIKQIRVCKGMLMGRVGGENEDVNFVANNEAEHHKTVIFR